MVVLLFSYLSLAALEWRDREAVFHGLLTNARKGIDDRRDKFQLVINLKAAKALGPTVPPSLLAHPESLSKARCNVPSTDVAAIAQGRSWHKGCRRSVTPPPGSLSLALRTIRSRSVPSSPAAALDPGRVKTPKERPRRGILFYRRRCLQAGLPSHARTWRATKNSVLPVLPAPAF
jgi:hypothetical protein